MFGLFKKKDPERDLALEDIKHLRGLVDGADSVTKATFGMALTSHWIAFTSVQHSLASFKKLPREKQMDYFRKWVDVVGNMQGNEQPTTIVSAEFLTQLLSAVIVKDTAIERDLIAYLTPYLRQGQTFS